jgi:uncharacterized protein YbjT (DUF2867 family)
LLGATGLIGRECLRLLAADARATRVIALVRREVPGLRPDDRVDMQVVDFDRLDDHADAFAVDAVICALGTTIKQAGSQENFRRVDHDYPLEAARLGHAAGCRHFLVVSALGANATSRVFYNRVKGELEAAVTALGIPCVTIVRPSLLLGDRMGARGEFRLGEEIGKRFAWVVPGNYRPVAARAGALVVGREARPGTEGTGVRIIESREIRTIARQIRRASANK